MNCPSPLFLNSFMGLSQLLTQLYSFKEKFLWWNKGQEAVRSHIQEIKVLYLNGSTTDNGNSSGHQAWPVLVWLQMQQFLLWMFLSLFTFPVLKLIFLWGCNRFTIIKFPFFKLASVFLLICYLIIAMSVHFNHHNDR